jgi:hypothetical protein
MVSIQELNYQLAQAQIPTKENPKPVTFTPFQLMKLVRPLGVCTTSEDTMNYTESGSFGSLRVLTVQGPAQITNIIGKNVEEGDTIYLSLYKTKETNKYRISKTAQLVPLEYTGSEGYWQYKITSGKSNTYKFEEDDFVVARLGRVQHVYTENILPTSFLNINNSDKDLGKLQTDMYFAQVVPAIRIFVDYHAVPSGVTYLFNLFRTPTSVPLLESDPVKEENDDEESIVSSSKSESGSKPIGFKNPSTKAPAGFEELEY